MRRFLTPSVRLTFGLVFLTSTLVVIADLLGLTPDPKNAQLEARMKLVETITIQVAEYVGKSDFDTANRVLATALERNTDALSAGLRKSDGTLLLQIKDHASHWTLKSTDHSTSDQIQVPIFKGNVEWGNVELRFETLHIKGPFGIPINLLLVRMVFFGILGYLVYFVFLRRALKYLDPSSVVPERVKAAMNALSEGVLILDEKARIVLANESFIEKTKFDEAKLLGKTPSELPWTINEHQDKATYPWAVALSQSINVAGESLSISYEPIGTKTFVVNVTPILSDKGKSRGALATFDDVTQIEHKNTQLKKMLSALKKTQLEINLQNQKLSVLASTDPLTGCLNRRAFFSIVKNSFDEAKNTQGAIACIMLDIDFFKKINDNYGHSIGDLVLSTVADCLKNALRNTDLLCRYGGEEFCIILRKSDIGSAQGLAERIRESIESLSFAHNPAAKDLTVTCSFGVSDITFEAADVEQLIDQADQSLYVSKDSGRNRVTRFDQVKNSSPEAPATPASPEEIHNEESIPQTDKVLATTENLIASLADRHGFIDNVGSALEEAKANGESFAVLFIDIDHLRRINTTLGYAAGDSLIREVAKRLSRLLRDSDRLVRVDLDEDANSSAVSHLGSDEFGLLVRNFGEASNVYNVAKRITQSLGNPLTINDQEIRVSASIGISVYPDDGETCEELVNSAERALGQAKQEGGNVFRRSATRSDPEAEQLIQIETALHGALERGEFRLFYQPKFDLHSHRIVGMEALLRWKNPSLGDIPPTTFIPLAENSGLINDIGRWVLRTACVQTKKWQSLGFDVTTAVNISTLQLKRTDFFSQFTKCCIEAGLKPEFIEIEITESMLMESFENVVAMLLRFHDIGVKIAVDDFGVGYSSLNYIKRLPIHTLKIDRSFVKDIPVDKDDAIIVSAIIAMARAMNLKTVAEGVEDAKQLAILRRLKCDEIQGFLFSKPVNALKATVLLHKNRERSKVGKTEASDEHISSVDEKESLET